jgi:hypothetical protein
MSRTGETAHDDHFARLAFGLLVSGIGVVATKKLLQVGRRHTEQGRNGVTFSNQDSGVNLVVDRDAVNFSVEPFGTHQITHDVADTILEDLHPGDTGQA